jgi:LuxR family maltose regulon positive regulatory protein
MTSNQPFYLPRTRLDDLLAAAIKKPLTFVVAGAGYGKTQAVSTFLEQQPFISVWLQLSELDNLESRLWENFCHVASFYSRDVSDKFASIGFPSSASKFARFLDCLQTFIDPSKRYVCVLDDCHLIHKPSIINFLHQFTPHCPPNFSIIVISRTHPDPNAVNFLSKGFLTTIDENDLRFNQEEISEYLQSQSLSVSTSFAATIYQITEGWIFALYLLGLALKKMKYVSRHEYYAFSAMRLNIFKLIEKEIFSPISPALQTLLIQLSLIEDLPLSLLQALAPDPDLITEMGKIGSFIRYDNHLHTYHIHHLLLNFLEQRQDRLTAAQIRAVYTQAAHWCASNGYQIDATTYYEKAGDYKQLVELIYNFPYVPFTSQAQFMLKVAERLPAVVFKQQPLAHALRPRALMTLGKCTEAVRLLTATVKKYEALPPSPFNHRLLASCYNYLGFNSFITCMFTAKYNFVPYFEKAHHYFELNPYTLTGPIRVAELSSYICRVSSPRRGDIEKYIDACQAALPFVTVTINGCLAGFDDLARAELHYYRNELTTCEHYLHQALQKAHAHQQYEIENRALFFFLRLGIHQRRYHVILDTIKQLNAQLKIPDFINRYHHYDIIMGWFYSQIGQTNSVASWLKDDFETNDLSSLVQGLEDFVRIKYYLTQKKYQFVLTILAKTNEYGLSGFLFGKIGINLTSAICHYHLKEKALARKLLTEAYQLAAPNGIEMPFIEYGQLMRTLATVALNDPHCTIPAQWLEKIRRQSSTYAKKVAHTATKYRAFHHLEHDVQLTIREKEILTDLYYGLSRSEIATSHNMSINTVKTTLQIIYLKLGARNAAHAIKVALEKKLLDEIEP